MKKSRTISRKEHDQILRSTMEDLMTGGEYILYSKKIRLIISDTNAIVLLILINQNRIQKDKRTKINQNLPEEKRKEYDGWFFCESQRIFRDQHFFEPRIEYRAIAHLKRMKLIRTERRGMPARRWIWIDFPRLWRMIDRKWREWMEKHPPKLRKRRKNRSSFYPQE